ncbi:MAG TPA: hypothetical protein VFX35_06315 [Solirubrobacterales bacterium]|nr:hypothetical protein [Solirubrobacterales bacterium]
MTVLGSDRTSLELDPAFTAKLDQLYVAVNPIFPAEHPGTFTFAIFGGRISPDLTGGGWKRRAASNCCSSAAAS